MKKLLPLILLILIGCSEPEPVNIDLMLELNDGFYTDKNSDKVFNGKAFSEFDSGQKKSIGVIKKGKKDGLWINYHEDGKVKSKIMFEDGIFIDLQPINGEFNEFDGNGNKTKSGFYLEGKKNGIFKTYFSDINEGWSEFSYKNEGCRMVVLRCIGPSNFFLERVLFPTDILTFMAPNDSRVEIWGNELYGPKLEERIRISADNEDSTLVA